MGKPRTLTIKKDSTENYYSPVTQEVDFSSASQLVITNKGQNEVAFKLDSSSEIGKVEAGKSVSLNCYSGVYDEKIIFSFYSPSEIQVDWTEGDAAGGGTAFDAKYTGYTIDLTSPDGAGSDAWPGFPLEFVEITIKTSVSLVDIYIEANAPNLRNINDLVDYLNVIQHYYFFVKVSETILGIQSGKFFIDTFNSINIYDDKSGNEIKYEQLNYVTSTEEYSTQDLILQQHRLNSRLSSVNYRIVEPPIEKPHQALAFQVISGNHYRETLTLVNTSTFDFYVEIMPNSLTSTIPTPDKYKYKIPQNGVLVINDNTNSVQGVWDTGVDNGALLVNVTY